MWPEWSYVRGMRVDYLSPTIYLIDILFLIMFLFTLFDSDYRSKFLLFFYKNIHYFILIIFFSIINIAFSANLYLAFYKWLTLYKFLYLGIYLFLENISLREISYVLAISIFVIFFSFILQLISQSSETRLFYLWGERRFYVNSPSIARFTFLGKEYLRPYAFFPHPNVLGGFSLVAFPLLFTIRQKFLKYMCIFLTISIMLLTVSHAVWVSGFVIAVLFLTKLKPRLNLIFLFILLFSFLTPLFYYFFTNTGLGVSRRYNLSLVSIYMIKDNPLFGLGLGNYVIEIFRYYQKINNALISEATYWIQPVHNIFLLLLSEMGFVGLIFVFLFIFKKLEKKIIGTPLSYSFLGVLLTGFFDHYWLTLPQAQFMLTLVITMLIKEILLAKKTKYL